MQQTPSLGIYSRHEKLFTVNPESCRGTSVYGEQLVAEDGIEYRSWNPYRSKLAAALLKGFTVSYRPTDEVLYLGAATGTTVSHVSDIVAQGLVYAVESAPLAMAQLSTLAKQRTNIIPLLADANHPDRYSAVVPTVGLVYQDIAQRNQAEIFLANAKRYLRDDGYGLLMVKARSIDVALPPRQAYQRVVAVLEANGYRAEHITDLTPFHRDHAAMRVLRR